MESMVSRDGDDRRVKYVFVCGLPRSGTSVIGRNIARLENCTGLHDTGVLEDEGDSCKMCIRLKIRMVDPAGLDSILALT